MSKQDVRHLHRSELPIDTMKLACYLIGKTLVHDIPEGRMSGRIVETEAYLPGDSSCHAFRGQTNSNRSLFLERGRAYVYFTYGTWFMLNVSSDKMGIGAGVLLRGLEPLEGIKFMQKFRGITKLPDLTRGPGRLASAMNIDKRFDGLDLCSSAVLWLGSAIQPTGSIGKSVRIGITREVHHLRRFYERGNPFVSGPKWLSP
jgi:DNA-3-methyladenine glycosylase